MSYGPNWIKKVYKVEMSEFGEQVAEFLNILFRGVYHIQGKGLKNADWASSQWIEVSITDYISHFSTYDFNLLTAIVVLSHDLCIRVELKPTSRHSIKLCFSPRKREGINFYDRMPTLEDHIELVRTQLKPWEIESKV
jgi:hypothetical protein